MEHHRAARGQEPERKIILHSSTISTVHHRFDDTLPDVTTELSVTIPGFALCPYTGSAGHLTDRREHAPYWTPMRSWCVTHTQFPEHTGYNVTASARAPTAQRKKKMCAAVAFNQDGSCLAHCSPAGVRIIGTSSHQELWHHPTPCRRLGMMQQASLLVLVGSSTDVRHLRVETTEDIRVWLSLFDIALCGCVLGMVPSFSATVSAESHPRIRCREGARCV